MKYGKPLVKSSEAEVDKDKQREDSSRTYPDDKDYAIAFITDIMKHAEENYSTEDGVFVRIDGVVMTIDELLATALSDALKAIMSCTFVFLYLNIHTRSCFLSALGMGIIVLSFPLTAVITNGIL